MVQRARKIFAQWNNKWMRQWGRDESSPRFGRGNQRNKRKGNRWATTGLVLVVFLLCSCIVVVFLRVLLASTAHSFTSLPEPISEKMDDLQIAPVNYSRNDYDGLPSCDRIVAFADEKGNGFGAQVNRVLEAAVLARFVGAVFILPTTKDWNYGCGLFKTWNCYFEDLRGECLGQDSKVHQIQALFSSFELGSCNSTLEEIPIGNGCWVAGSEKSERFIHMHLVKYFEEYQDPSSQMLSAVRSAAHSIIDLNPSLQSLLAKVRSALSLDGPYIGVHLRRGDKAKEVAFRPTKLYATLVQNLSADRRDVFVATDDFRQALALRKLLMPSGYRVVTLASEARSGHSQHAHNKLKGYKRFESTVELLLELSILAESDIFVCAFSSNAARLAHAMRLHPANSSVSVDDRWLPGVAYHTFGQKYCTDRDANIRACSFPELQK